MATNDKHCQTFSIVPDVVKTVECPRGMYDETVEVDAREIESPQSSEEEPVKAAMAKFNPPVRHTRHDFDSDSDSESAVEDFNVNLSEEDKVFVIIKFLYMYIYGKSFVL